MVWVRVAEPIKRKTSKRTQGCWGVRTPRTGCLACGSITRDCMSLTVPGPPQRSRPAEVYKRMHFKTSAYCLVSS